LIISVVIVLIMGVVQVCAQSGELPDRLLVGYWHNWGAWPNTVYLTDVPDEYDVINIAFAVPIEQFGSEMIFTPDYGIYPDHEDFIADVQALQNNGKKVVISIGGANAAIHIDDSTAVDQFISSMSGIVNTYGFDGLDIDLEGGSLMLQQGDNDFHNPTSPLVVYFIEAINSLLDILPDGFILSAAPETAYIQGGYTTYNGIWGAYLPVIHAVRDRLTYIHVQHYNTGSMYGRDGAVYEPATADFHVAMADMLIAGFNVDIWNMNLFFEPLLPEQVLIGLPASPSAAGSGYTPPIIVYDALNYLILGNPFGGSYQLADPNGYNSFRGLMTWSINWDIENNNEFGDSYRPYFDSLGTNRIDDFNPPAKFNLAYNYPNPFNNSTIVNYTLQHNAYVKIDIYDIHGRLVENIVDSRQSAGLHRIVWNAKSWPSGVYFYNISADVYNYSGKMILVK